MAPEGVASTSASAAGWPADHVAPRKALPIKRNDAEPLTREDLQYDLLKYLWDDKHRVFTNVTPGHTETFKCTFGELYVNALFNSTRCSKVLKEKMTEMPVFATELAKISLLTNVGRINTTMAFFPEMKTALRTYHPVPSLQKTDGNAQDAPRIKNCLKAALLPHEAKSGPPSSPDEILEKAKEGVVPPTSVVNLIFVLANHASQPLAPHHFDSGINFLDLFLPSKITSLSRANAFLWLMFHYLEGVGTPNPWDDEHSRKNPGKVPLLRRFSERDIENVDPEDEVEWGRMMSTRRNVFLQKLVASIEKEKKAREAKISSAQRESEGRRRSRTRRPTPDPPQEKFHYYVPPDQPPQQRLPPPGPSRPIRLRIAPNQGPWQPRDLLQHAWHVVNTTDPLADSDEELADEHVRLDYTRRLEVLNRIRGKRSLTPEPAPLLEDPYMRSRMPSFSSPGIAQRERQMYA